MQPKNDYNVLPNAATIGLSLAQTAIMRQLYHTLVNEDNIPKVAMIHGGLGVFVFFVSFASRNGFAKKMVYGRHSSIENNLPKCTARWAWVMQELPTLCASVPMLWHLYRVQNGSVFAPNMLPLALFTLHYAHRTLVYPFMMLSKNPYPFFSMMSATAYCNFNGVLQCLAGGALVASSPGSSRPDAATNATTLAGAVTFVLGMAMNMHSDYTLIGLRKSVDAGEKKQKMDEKKKLGEVTSPTTSTACSAAGSHYKIPHGGMFKFVSCPNFLGEAIEWLGYSLVVAGVSDCSWTDAPFLGAVSFAVFTVANTFPRGWTHHQWYLEHFGETYKKLGRRAVIPFFF